MRDETVGYIVKLNQIRHLLLYLKYSFMLLIFDTVVLDNTLDIKTLTLFVKKNHFGGTHFSCLVFTLNPKGTISTTKVRN